jgi:hypothetical protein
MVVHADELGRGQAVSTEVIEDASLLGLSIDDSGLALALISRPLLSRGAACMHVPVKHSNIDICAETECAMVRHGYEDGACADKRI